MAVIIEAGIAKQLCTEFITDIVQESLVPDEVKQNLMAKIERGAREAASASNASKRLGKKARMRAQQGDMTVCS